MSSESFTTSFTVDRSPKQVFDAINDVRAWWSGNIDGRTDALGAEFTYRYKRVHRTTQKITELVPNQKVVWHVTDSFINFGDPNEWTGTDVVFEIGEKGGKTEVRFTHSGLVPSFECYDACRKGWTFYVQESLRKLITSGEGEPAKAEKSYTKSFTVKATPEEVFDAINDVRGWWSEDIEGPDGQARGDVRVSVQGPSPLDARDHRVRAREEGRLAHRRTQRSTSSRTNRSGMGPTSCSRSRRKTTRPRCGSRTWGWFLRSSATVIAPVRGAFTWTASAS